MKTTATLSISHRSLSCSDVVDHLFHAGVLASVTSNLSVVKGKNGALTKESGCRIVTTVKSKDEITSMWKGLESRFGLTCANLKLDGSFNGCIMHYLANFKCTAKKKQTSDRV